MMNTVNNSKKSRSEVLVQHVRERRVLYSVLCFVLTVLLAIGWHRHSQFTHLLRYGQNLFPHQPGPCYNIPGVVVGAEDVEQFSTGLAFISTVGSRGSYSHNRSIWGLRFDLDPEDNSPWKDRHGEILLFDFNAPTKGAVPLTIEGKLNRKLFNPHGLGSWQNPDGSFSLFVVNHLEEESVVDRFLYNLQRPSVLRHEDTIRSSSFNLLSDVAATGPRSFYYTNSFRHRTHNGIMQKLELQFSLSLGSIGHCMRQSCGKVVEGLRIPNGIAMSPDKSLVYLSHMGGETVEVYEIQEHHGLHEKQEWPVETAINNINVDPVTGDLWAGATPALYKSMVHSQDLSYPCPSQVLHFKTKDGVITKMREVYAEDGTRFVSLSTSSVFYNKKLLIGSAFSKAVLCEVMYAW